MSGVRKTTAIESSAGGSRKHPDFPRPGAIPNSRWFPTCSHLRFFGQRARAFCRLTHSRLITYKAFCPGLLLLNRQDKRP